MGAEAKALQKGDYLFREGDPSDAAFVLKSGRIAIVKSKGNSDIELAQIGPGQMFGEMAFFDGKARSAGAKALTDTVVILLPFVALNAQFHTFPQWLKTMVKTINENLREANRRIKNLEQTQKSEDFSPYQITKLTMVLTFLGRCYGEKKEDGTVELNGQMLRNYTIQVFQEPTSRMQKIVEIFEKGGLLKNVDLGEQKTIIQFSKLQLLADFADFYNKWLFTEDSKKTIVTKQDSKVLKALVHYSAGATADAKGLTKINVTQIQEKSQADLGYQVQVGQWSDLIEKKVVSDQMTDPAGFIFVTCNLEEIKKLESYWQIYYLIEEAQSPSSSKKDAA